MDKKRQLINKLKGEHKVLCPKCKCEIFLKKSVEKVSINVTEDCTSDDYIEYVGDEEYKCQDCGRKLRESEFE